MTRPRGRIACGARLVYDVPYGHWKTTTFLAALRVTGLTAPLVVDGAINGELFRSYVEQHLAPTLSAGDVVILDNLNSHKVAGVRAAIEAREARVLYLPPYSPDLNPIEQVFAKFKWLVRSAQERTLDGLWRCCGQLLHRFSQTECHNYFRHCGYRYA
jgi:transposase